jgi:2-oxoglutarate ferredoxin oxidoreductase subunit alpha
MSMGQMVKDVKCAVEYKLPVSFYGRTGGIIPTPSEVYNEIVRLSGGER